LDLDEPKIVTFSEPTGWQLIDLRKERTSKRSAQAFAVVIQIIQNHQNGRDTHIRFIFKFILVRILVVCGFLVKQLLKRT
jgi:hypothetical protein